MKPSPMTVREGLYWTSGFIVGAIVYGLLGWIAVAVWAIVSLAAVPRLGRRPR